MDYLSICKEVCNKEVTKEEVIYSVNCGFCDVPYILLGVDACESFK